MRPISGEQENSSRWEEGWPSDQVESHWEHQRPWFHFISEAGYHRHAQGNKLPFTLEAS